MNVPQLIERKREGFELTDAELEYLLQGLVDESVPLYQISAWLMAVNFRGMTRRETAAFTRFMMQSGDILRFEDPPAVPVDKHSTGGVGDKITIPLAPVVAACGVYVPMISGRGLGHTGGTLDKLESIPGLRTDFGEREFRAILDDVGFSIIGASAKLAPADAKLYALRDVTGTVPSIPLITGSILSKKYAAGVEGLVLDVKCGSGAFMRHRDDALALARELVEVSRQLGKDARAVVTSMEQPLGRTIGNALEVRESIDVLSDGGPDDVRELVLTLGVEMVLLTRPETPRDEARADLEGCLASGVALEQFERWVERTGGDPRVVSDPSRLASAPVVGRVTSAVSGWVSAFDTREIGFAANSLGAGRAQVGDAVDPAVGFVVLKKVGDRVERGEPLAEIHARSDVEARAAAERYEKALEISPERPVAEPLILSAAIEA